VLDWRRARRSLLIATALVSVLGLAIEALHVQQPDAVGETLVAKLSLSYESNLPTWFASSLLLLCAVAAGAIAMRAPRHRLYWWSMAALAGWMSLDEAAELHEHLGGVIGDTSGVLYFDWVIPAAVLVVAVTIAFVPFIRALHPRTRTRLIIACAVYVGGALLMELPLGWWTEQHGNEGFGYALIDWVEETMELVGSVLAFGALLAHREETEP